MGKHEACLNLASRDKEKIQDPAGDKERAHTFLQLSLFSCEFASWLNPRLFFVQARQPEPVGSRGMCQQMMPC